VLEMTADSETCIDCDKMNGSDIFPAPVLTGYVMRPTRIAVRATLLAAIAIVMGANVSAQQSASRQSPAHPKLDAELSAIVNDDAQPLASLSVLAVRGGKIVYQKQFGRRYIDEKNPANSKLANDATMYRMASISKLVTTLGVIKLVEDGKLALDADVSEYLGYKLRNPNFPADPITLRMLLSHTSSLRDDAGYYWEAKLKVDLKDVLLPEGKLFGNGDAWAKNAKPGAYFQYANFPWGLIGTIMEKVTGERFDRLMRRLILDPLDLRGGFHPADFTRIELDNTATLYRKRDEINGKEVWNPAGPWVVQVDDYSAQAPVPRALADYAVGTNGTLFGPQGNCRLSAAGLGRIMLILMNDGSIDGKRILEKTSVDEMFRTQWRFDVARNNGNSSYGAHKDAMNAWGLGNQQFLDIGGGDRLVEGGGFKAVGHTGDAWGLTSAMLFDRTKKNGMIFLVGGPGFDPETTPGKYSAHHRYEERILTALYRHAIVSGAK
jgi:CubicO group peptidase (beta-lactamase class C family)